MKLISHLVLAFVFVLFPALLRAEGPLPAVDAYSAMAAVAESVPGSIAAESGTVPAAESIAAESGTGPVAGSTNGESMNSSADESVDEAVIESPQIADPLAPVNKVMFTVNDKFYFWVLKPVATGYAHVPVDFRDVFSNVYDNLWAPSRVINNLLQLRLKGAGNELLRFVLNSVVGIAGCGDAARDAFGIKKQEADFGQTLGHYGIGHRFYLVLPFYGPSSLRDGVGLVGDQFMHPLTYVKSNHLTFGQKLGISAHEKVNSVSYNPDDYQTFKDAAVDPYVAMRDAFVQYRKHKVDESKK